MSLDELGTRICIMGPSGSGKSTLAAAVGRVRDLPVVHLDQYRHVPGSQWQERPDDIFARLHDDAVNGEQWVIEGNYSRLLPQRLTRATGLILLDSTAAKSVARYLLRTWGIGKRIGGLEGTRDKVSSAMLRYIVGTGQVNRRKYRALFNELSIPTVFLSNRGALNRFYRNESLDRSPRES